MKNRPLIVICLVFLLIRYLCFWAGDRYQFPPEVIRMDGKKIRADGQIVRREQRKAGPVWYLRVKDRTYFIYGSEKSCYRIGNTITVTGTFHLFEKTSNPGTFDSRSYYQNQQIYGSIIPNEITVTDHTIQYGKEWLTLLRERWKEELLSRMGKKGAVLSGILLGDKSEMEPETKELYQKNGIAHLLAVSGLHVSFIGLLIYRAMRKAGMTFWISATAGILILFPYAIMTGFSISAKRAVLMYLIRMGAEITGRVYDLPTSLAVSATVVLGSMPMAVFDTGFLLSFGAVFAIWIGEDLKACIVERRGKRGKKGPLDEQKKGRLKIAALDAFWPGFWIQCLTFPVLLSSYYEFPFYSILLNIWVIPLMSVVMGAGLAGSMCCLMNLPAADGILQISKAVLSFYEWNCNFMLKLPLARIITGQPGEFQIGLYVLLLFLAVLFLRKGEKTAGLILIILGFLSLLGPWNQQAGKALITMIDVGQGDGILIQTPGGINCMVDGGSISEEMLARYTLEPFLESRRISELDYVFITHGDTDHISGIEEMLKRQKIGVRIEALVLPDRKFWDDGLKKLALTAQKAGTKVQTISEGQSIEDSMGAELRCIGPSVSYRGERGNSASLILSFSYNKFSMLFTGDLEGEGEESFLKGLYGKDSYTVLKVAHHGSDSSTTDDFLKRNRFDYAVISAGEDNPYGHPGRRLLKRLEDSKIRSFCTKDDGAVMIKSDGETMIIQKFLD